MDAAFYWAVGLAISAFAGFVVWMWKDSKREAERRLQADIDRLTDANQQKDKINEIQSSPFPDAKSANSWLSKFRAKSK